MAVRGILAAVTVSLGILAWPAVAPAARPRPAPAQDAAGSVAGGVREVLYYRYNPYYVRPYAGRPYDRGPGLRYLPRYYDHYLRRDRYCCRRRY